MTKRMLIDSTHDEETRVAVVDDKDGRLLEFDYENKSRKPLKGSIFLAKVTRVEPSLQAAFVNYGGNRHGFLPFSEIHPDYFRIPVADEEALKEELDALIAEEEERERIEEEEERVKNEAEKAKSESGGDAAGDEEVLSDNVEEVNDDEKSEVEELNMDDQQSDVIDADDEGDSEDTENYESDQDSQEVAESDAAADFSEDMQDEDGNVEVVENSSEEDAEENIEDAGASSNEDGESEDDQNKRGRRGRRYNNRRGRRGGRGRGGNRHRRAAYDSQKVEILGGTEYEDDQNSAAERFRFSLRRKYKIQEVIKRGQIMLIQVSREERGNKGAAVSTYLSLPGRYGVLMPNSPRAGGISRKISNYNDRQRMRETLREMDIPKRMSVILRTAGVTRTKTEIKRDIDYLMKLWQEICDITKESYAPAAIYEEANLIKKAIRDLYVRDIDEVLASGDNGYKNAKKIMKMLIPSHAKKVKQYKEQIPLFHKYGVESQIAEMNEPTARLKSGGYLVINPTEALVSIDVNSGRATKERHIEETALNTNLEAAGEVARQLKLRDLGGLVVIDFIDMEDRRNNAKVERRLKEALSNDRARIQIGRISSFGLLELSRQRLNPSLTEAQFDVCKACDGRGVVRNNDATSIMLLRAVEEEGIKGKASEIVVYLSNEVAVYILNNKRVHLQEIETCYNISVLIKVDDEIGPGNFRIEALKPAVKNDEDDDYEDEASENSDERKDRNKRRKRGGRSRNNNNRNQDQGKQDDQDEENVASDKDQKGDEKEEPKKSKRRSPKKSKKSDVVQDDAQNNDDNDAAAKSDEDKLEAKEDEKSEKSKRKRTSKKKEEAPSEDLKNDNADEKPKNKKKGWWNRLTE